MSCRKKFKSRRAKRKYEAYKHLRLVKVKRYYRRGRKVRSHWRLK